MQWSSQQTGALDAVGRWLRQSADQCFRLFGFAGTGKSTLAKYLAEDAGQVLFGAYTGKAASVMRKRGCPNAYTIHQLIYLPSSRSRARLNALEEELWELESEIPPEDRAENAAIKKVKIKIEEEKKRLKAPMFTLNPESPVKDADLIVIDECSMVDERMGMDLLSFGTPVLVLGDPAQLPPVRGGNFFTGQRPDVMLTEIHRQAKGNPIIELATRIREGRGLADGHYGESLVMRGKPPQELVTGCDQILVGTNETRRKCNGKMRRLRNYQNGLPEVGDRLVCLRNDHEAGLLNGTLWHVQETLPPSELDSLNRVSMLLKDEDGHESLVEAHTQYFEGGEPPYWEIREAQCFDYGYALTTHKAQGSQWGSVFVFDESYVFRASAKEWLYTAVTRAAERVVVCRS